jgi:hypothetical protein
MRGCGLYSIFGTTQRLGETAASSALRTGPIELEEEREAPKDDIKKRGSLKLEA